MILLVFWVFAFAPMTASAVVFEGLFEVKVPVLNESKEIRRAALNDGLIEVLIRVSGDSDIVDKIEAPVADSYVKRYEYLTQAAIKANGPSSQLIWVRYNATKILGFLRKQAIPIWGERRSLAVIWLAVSDGRQRYILKNGDTSLLKSEVDTAFSHRGIPTIWPQIDARDQKNVRFADILVGFTDPLKHASKRYSSGPIVMANMVWNGSVWKGEWTLLMAGDVSKWSLSGADYAILIAKATDRLADVMGGKYAVLETFDVSQQQKIEVEIDRVENVETFRRIEKHLLSLSAVESVQLSHVEPERVFFNLVLRSKVDDLLNQIKSGSMMFLLPDDDAADLNDKSKAVSPADVVTAMTVPDATVTDSDSAAPSMLKPRSYRFVLY